MSEPSRSFKNLLTKAPQRIFEIVVGWILTLKSTTVAHGGQPQALAIAISLARIG
jgi:hypothetical protein